MNEMKLKLLLGSLSVAINHNLMTGILLTIKLKVEWH